MPTVEWPSASEATFGCTPLFEKHRGERVTHVVQTHTHDTGFVCDVGELPSELARIDGPTLERRAPSGSPSAQTNVAEGS